MNMVPNVDMMVPNGGTGGGITALNVNTTPILGGVSGRLLYDNAGTLGEAAGSTWSAASQTLTLAGASVAASTPLLNLSQTWNDGAGGTISFTGIQFNATDTSSAATSKLLDLQRNGASQFNVDKYGNIFTQNGANSKHVFGGIDLGGLYNFWGGKLVVQYNGIPNGGTVVSVIGGNLTTGDVYGLDVAAQSTGTVFFRCNQQNSGGNACFVMLLPAAASSGMAFQQYNVNGGQSWCEGINAGAGAAGQHGSFLICNSGDLQSGNVIELNTGNSVILGSAAIAANATDGFLYIPTCAGTPTGTPTTRTGRVPMVFDTTNSQFWFYTGGAWKQPKTPAGAALVTWQ